MKKINVYILMSFVLGMSSLSLEAASHSASTYMAYSTAAEDDNDDDDDDEYDIVDGDEIDNNDVLASPFDDSEAEDEEDFDCDEDSDMFHNPHSH